MSNSAESILLNGTDQVIIRDNVIVMDIDNLLTGWPTYEINFTPENPGPLAYPVKMVRIEESTDSEAELLIPGKPKRKRTPLSERESKKIKFSADTIKITEDLAGLKLTSQSSGNNSNFKAKPVRLVGIPKNPPPLKPKFDGSIAWPPRRRHHCRDVEDNDSIASLDLLRALPAPVTADLA
ncbi:hypothetical protein DEU56DRAFT_917559 [Suillus clintonianus]|uniref:uncharacterized protein n=1 Tax=Suillus clintonianus TaxID=1904413 RepID=UPI001B85BFCB|nr:uncharacterized protein DEU56DRAFT_917559 [Suillus clintonianus]KAG2123250.1 hypothetical protein DEU56DRAFT_917559 [Suillus clintonianus]